MTIIEKKSSQDGMATRYSFKVRDAIVHGTYVGRPEKHIICFSTQLGCAVDCLFCAAGPPVRPLMTGDMLQMCLAMVSDQRIEGTDDRKILFSAMGEGEPLFSQWQRRQVVGALNALRATVAHSKFALSTSGINPAEIRQLAVERPAGDFKLQVSMPSVDPKVRQLLMKNAASATDVRAAVGYYQGLTQGKVEWNVVLFQDLNDSQMAAFELAKLLGAGEHVKLTRYNEIRDRGLTPSTRAPEYANILSRMGIRVEHYQTNGADVDGSCGQLRHTLVQLAAS